MSIGFTPKKSLPVSTLCPFHTHRHAVCPSNSFCTLPNLFSDSLYLCRTALENSEDGALKGTTEINKQQRAQQMTMNQRAELSLETAGFMDHDTTHHLCDLGHIRGSVPGHQFPHVQDRTNHFNSCLKGLTWILLWALCNYSFHLTITMPRTIYSLWGSGFQDGHPILLRPYSIWWG